MKQVEISKLMDAYTDTEFFPAGAPAADPEVVKARVLARLNAPAGNNDPAGRRRLPRKKKLLLAAGLAAALLLMGAGLPYLQHRLVSGELFYQQTGDGTITGLVHYGPVMELEEGRLFFVRDDGQRLDLTDQIDEHTPYLYDGSDPETDKVYYLILGGTPDGYGYLEWVRVPEPFGDGDDAAGDGAQSGAWTSYNFSYVAHDGQPDRYEVHDGGPSEAAIDWNTAKDYPWLVAGAKELGLPFVDTESGTDDVFYAP